MSNLQVKPDKVCQQIGLCLFNGAEYVRSENFLIPLVWFISVSYYKVLGKTHPYTHAVENKLKQK